MTKPFEKMSAKELFELAKNKLQREQEEARRAELATKEYKQRYEQLLAAHEEALAAIDREFAALTQRRAQLIADFPAKISNLKREMAERAPSAALPPVPVPHSRAGDKEIGRTLESGGGTKTTSDDALAEAILEIMKGRMDISDTLLREKLRERGFGLTNFNKILERLVREGRIVSRGLGNYGLKRKL